MPGDIYELSRKAIIEQIESVLLAGTAFEPAVRELQNYIWDSQAPEPEPPEVRIARDLAYDLDYFGANFGEPRARELLIESLDELRALAPAA